MNNFFIFNCKDEIVGNPKGYPTIKGAIKQQNTIGSKAYNGIWDAFYELEAMNAGNRNISTIHQIEA